MRANPQIARRLARGYCPACAAATCEHCRLATEPCRCACAGQRISRAGAADELRWSVRNLHTRLTLFEFQTLADLTTGGSLTALRSDLRRLGREARTAPKRNCAARDYLQLSTLMKIGGHCV